MCHTPADIFNVDKRGYIREGYWADLVLLEEHPQTVTTENIHYKCGWSPLEGDTLPLSSCTYHRNGNVVYEQGLFYEHIERKTFII
ncbi:MAG: hypothetical protein U5L09_09790 [Bacteroidales bacterium]|nr:hypothetical protein [Bacteroidales bacterium]